MIIQTINDLDKLFEKIKESIVFWDIETTGLIYYDKSVERYGDNGWEELFNGDEIIGHALLLPSTGESFYIPVRMNNFENLPINTVNDRLKELFQNTPVCGWNIKFDCKFAEKEGIEFKNEVLDGMLLSHAANENEQSFGLKELGVKYVGLDANEEKLALTEAQNIWIENEISPLLDTINTIENAMTAIEREWKVNLKEDYKAELAEVRKKLTAAKKAGAVFHISGLTVRIDTLRGRITDITKKNPNSHLSELPPIYLEHKNQREDLMEQVNRIKKIKPIENLRNLPLEVVAKYAEQDVILTHALYELAKGKLEAEGLWELATNPKTGICPYGRAIGRMESNGILMDVEFIDRAIENCNQKQSELEMHCYTVAGQEFNLNSPAQIKTLTGLESTAREFLEVSEHPVAQAINEYRQWGRARDTYFLVFKEYLDKDNRLHPDLLLLTVAGRASMKRPSMNTLPRESDIYNVRGAIVASPGYRLGDIDYSQIELRLLAHHSGDKNLINAYENGIDIHQQTADMIGVSRQVAKRVNFSVVYGSGPAGLVNSLRMERVYLYKLLDELPQTVKDSALNTAVTLFKKDNGIAWMNATPEQKQTYLELGAAKNVLEDYKRRFPQVEAYLKRTLEFAKTQRYTEMWTGRRRRYPNMKSAAGGAYNLSRTAPNNQIQGGAAELLRLAITKMDRKFEQEKSSGPVPRLLLQVHDSILVEVPDNEDFDGWVGYIVKTMTGIAKFRVPIEADAKVGYRWNELTKWEGK